MEYVGINSRENFGDFVFTIICPDSFIEDSYSPGEATFNLLTQTLSSWTLPTISGLPTSCFTLVFDKIFSSIDDTEMSLVNGEFAFTSTQMTLTHELLSYEDRNTLFSKGPDFYLIGDVTGINIDLPTTTS